MGIDRIDNNSQPYPGNLNDINELACESESFARGGRGKLGGLDSYGYPPLVATFHFQRCCTIISHYGNINDLREKVSKYTGIYPGF